jgi:hypothetical protein
MNQHEAIIFFSSDQGFLPRDLSSNLTFHSSKSPEFESHISFFKKLWDQILYITKVSADVSLQPTMVRFMHLRVAKLGKGINTELADTVHSH